MFNVYTKKKKQKRGSAIFMSVIAGIIVVSALAVGLTKFMHITFTSTDSASATMQAQQYVRSEAELLHLVAYDDLKAVSKEAIKNSSFKKEIKLSGESNYCLGQLQRFQGTALQKAATSLQKCFLLGRTTA